MESTRVKQKALECGFDLVGIAPARRFPEADACRPWVERGYAAEMRYLARNIAKREDCRILFPPARSVIVVGMSYHPPSPPTDDHSPATHASISRYARGDDYHDVLKRALYALAEVLQAELPHPLRYNVCVDTAPILERLHGYYAGLGWVGKNTTLINQHYGSWFFLGELLVDLELEPDTPVADRCGACTRCLDACPTGALVAPRLLDARRCLSYLTIEFQGIIPAKLRLLLGNTVFGCDRCQQVCPWNASARLSARPEFQPHPHLECPSLVWLAELSLEKFHKIFKKSPILRTKFQGLLRNTVVAIGNSGNAAFIPLLERIASNADSVVMPHVLWALEKLKR